MHRPHSNLLSGGLSKSIVEEILMKWIRLSRIFHSSISYINLYFRNFINFRVNCSDGSFIYLFVNSDNRENYADVTVIGSQRDTTTLINLAFECIIITFYFLF